MDEPVNPAPARFPGPGMLRLCMACLFATVGWMRVRIRLALLFLSGVALLAGSAAAQQALPDPTRPAVGASQPGAAEESPGGPQLQSILISPKRKLAVINGQTLHVGDSFGNAVVVKISAQEVVLKSGAELQVLKLFPGVEKRKSVAGKVASQKVKDR